MKIEIKKEYVASLSELVELVKDVKSDRNNPLWRLYRKIMYEETEDHQAYHCWLLHELENAAIEKLKEVLDDIIVTDEDGVYTLLQYSNSTLDDDVIWMDEKEYKAGLN